MDRDNTIARLENIAKHAVHTAGEDTFILSLDDGLAIHEAIEALKAQLSHEGATSDLISRQAAIDALQKCRKHCIDQFDRYHIDIAENQLRNLPTVQPELTDIDAREAVYNLAEKIGIHQLFALTVELRGEPIQPEPHEGHWIEVAGELECSECHTVFTDLYPDYEDSVACPHCGAKMKGERKK